METAAAAFEKSGHGGLVKDEKRAEADGDDDRRNRLDMVTKQVDRQKSSSPNTNREEASSDVKEDEELEATKAEMGEVIEENRKLKMYLERLTKEYQNLQMQFQDAHQEVVQKPSLDQSTSTVTGQELLQEQEISLSLGRTVSSRNPKKDEREKSLTTSKRKEDDHMKEGLSLGLDCKFEVVSKLKTSTTEHMRTPTPEDSSEGTKEEEAGEILPPPEKGTKTTRTGDDEALQQNNPKRARVSVRTRCDTPTMNDGCQWRKYGQKIAKGNPCPRAYYRCTIGPSCPVRKQVQRCSDDMSILITTYEGTHNHPLPVSATAMASTTSAAASMLLSGSTSSRPGGGIAAPSMTASTDLHGLNFYLSDNNKSNHQQFYLPNSSFSTSTNNAHPTITLDLTNSNPLSSTSSSSIYSHLNRFSSSASPSPFPQRFSSSSSTSLNFSSSELTNSVPLSWGNNVLNYGSSQQQGNNYNNKTTQFGPLNLGRPQNQESFYQNFMQKNIINQVQSQQQPPLPDTIAAATKAITSDPSFQSALAAALTSIMGGGANASQGGAENYSSQKFIKWSSEQLSANNNNNAAYQSPPKVSNNCASSYLNRPTSSTNSPAGSLTFLSSNSLPFPTTKSASTSPGHSKEHVQLN